MCSSDLKEQIEFTELVETLLSGDVTGALAMAGRGIGGTVFSDRKSVV